MVRFRPWPPFISFNFLLLAIGLCRGNPVVALWEVECRAASIQVHPGRRQIPALGHPGEGQEVRLTCAPLTTDENRLRRFLAEERAKGVTDDLLDFP